MREIKFRAWDKEEGKMVRVDAIIFNGAVFEAPGEPHIIDQHNDIHLLKDVELLQYTGLKDRNGREIYEGDIIRIRETRLDDWEIYQVIYCGDNDYPAFDTKPHIDCDSNGLSYAMAVCEVAVIGNIHDNPELLEEGGD